jgi:tRNA(adenine34) deaminase
MTPDSTQLDLTLMDRALAMARRAMATDEVPIGAVIAGPDGAVLAEAHNRRMLDGDPTAHAEMLAIRAAATALGDWRLEGCTLAVTLEPCPMCAGAVVLARIPRLVYGCDDPKGGAVRTLYRLCEDQRLNHRVEVVPHVQAEPARAMLRDFFRAQRAKGKK